MEHQVLSVSVDKDDLDLLGLKVGPSSGYARTTTRPQKYIHHVVAERMGLSWNKKTQVIDHINRNKLDNRRDNLRVVSRSKNIVNSVKCDKAKGYTKVAYGWYANIMRDGSRLCKFFRTEHEAQEYVKSMREKYDN